MTFKPGQLIRHYQVSVPRNGSFRAVLTGTDLVGSVVQIDYETIGICVAVRPEAPWLHLLTVLFGDQLVDVSAHDMEAYDV